MILNKEQIKEIIPQKEPFLFVDEINYMDDKVVKGCYYLKENVHFLDGHFPDYKVMPGVLVIEALAQNACVLLLSMPQNKGKKVLFTSIDKFRFKGQVLPNQKLELEATFTKQKLNFYFAEVIAKVDSKVVAKGEITCTVF